MTLKARIMRTEALWWLPWEVRIVDTETGSRTELRPFWSEKGAERWARKELARITAGRARKVRPREIHLEEGR